MDDVNTPGTASTRVTAPTGAGAAPDGPATPLSDDALEISKLLVEVLQVGYPGRRGGASSDPDAPQVERGAVTSQLIRAAIHIYGQGPQTIGQLADGLGISQGWASRVVDEMERTGYLVRERDPQDRRVVRVRLAPEAIERVERAYRWRGDAVEEALAGLSDGERAAIRSFLARFVEAVRARS